VMMAPLVQHTASMRKTEKDGEGVGGAPGHVNGLSRLLAGRRARWRLPGRKIAETGRITCLSTFSDGAAGAMYLRCTIGEAFFRWRFCILRRYKTDTENTAVESRWGTLRAPEQPQAARTGPPPATTAPSGPRLPADAGGLPISILSGFSAFSAICV
jgi:hypothetical protein